MKKFKVFQSKYPLINSLTKQGYTQVEIIEKLKLEHDLELSVNTFKSYLYRLKKSGKINIQNVIASENKVSVGEHNQNDNVHKVSDNLTPSPIESNDSEDDEKPDDLPSTQQVLNNRQKGQRFIQNLLKEN